MEWGLLTASISAVAAVSSAIAAWKTLATSRRVHETQQLLNQRQLLLPLWEYLSDLSEIDPNAPVTMDVVKMVNTLELVALCCEGGMVDSQLIRRTFRDGFVRAYQAVASCRALPGLTKTGLELLQENRAAQAFYEELAKEHRERDKPTALTR